MYCVIKCVKTKRVLKGKFALSVFHSCNAKTQKTQICITGPQFVKFVNVILEGAITKNALYHMLSIEPNHLAA
jgi:hypothetical protein